jgi:hypothetical protein
MWCLPISGGGIERCKHATWCLLQAAVGGLACYACLIKIGMWFCMWQGRQVGLAALLCLCVHYAACCWHCAGWHQCAQCALLCQPAVTGTALPVPVRTFVESGPAAGAAAAHQLRSTLSQAQTARCAVLLLHLALQGLIKKFVARLAGNLPIVQPCQQRSGWGFCTVASTAWGST